MDNPSLLTEMQALCAVGAISGYEDDLRALLLEKITPHAEDVSVDCMGNIVAFKRGRARPPVRVLVAAHYDEVGLLVKTVTAEGYLTFGAVGGVDPRVLLGKKVLIAGKTPGVIGLLPIHLTTAEGRKISPRIENLCIDIGAGDKKEAAALAAPGDPVTFVCTPRVQGDVLFAKAADDRFGVAALLALLREQLAYDTYFAFTVQEELGLRGARVLANRLEPQRALIIESTTAADLPACRPHERVCTLGGGAVIAYMDGGALYDAELSAEICNLAQRHGIPWQQKSQIAGGTDAGALVSAAFGCRVCGISLPVRYLHSPLSLCHIGDIDAAYRLASLFLQDGGLYR